MSEQRPATGSQEQDMPERVPAISRTVDRFCTLLMTNVYSTVAACMGNDMDLVLVERVVSRTEVQSGSGQNT